MATLLDMFDTVGLCYKNPPKITNYYVLRSLIFTALSDYRGKDKVITLQNNPGIAVTISSDLTVVLNSNFYIDKIKCFGFITNNRFIGIDNGKSIISDVEIDSNNEKYEVLPTTETTLAFVHVFDRPLYSELYSAWFLGNMSSDPFEKIKEPKCENIIARAVNMNFTIPKHQLTIFSPIEIGDSGVIYLPFDVTSEAKTWFIDKLKDNDINVESCSYTKENAMSVMNLVKFFKIQL